MDDDNLNKRLRPMTSTPRSFVAADDAERQQATPPDGTHQLVEDEDEQQAEHVSAALHLFIGRNDRRKCFGIVK